MSGCNKTGGSEQRGRFDDLHRRARELRAADAFAPADTGLGTTVGIEQVAADLRASRRGARRTALVFGAAMVAVALFSLLLPYTADSAHSHTVYAPADVLDACALFFRMNVLPLFDPTQANLALQAYGDFASTHGNELYEQVMFRFALTALTVVCGFLLAASGLLFQTAFRNPLAAPTMLGVSDGVSIGYIIYLFCGYTSMPNNPPLFFACVYAGGVAVLLFVLFSSRYIAGSKTYNVFDMLLIGTVVSQMVGGVVTFITNYGMDYDTWESYYELLQSIDVTSEPLTYYIAFGVALVATLPVLLLRFRMNLIAYSDDDGRMLGVHPALLRGVAMACGALMQLAALASIGQVAMVSLAVPFLVRFAFPSDFRYQLLGNFLVGSLVLLLCQALAHFLVFGAVPMPVGTIVGVVIMPFFVWMMALQKRGWE